MKKGYLILLVIPILMFGGCVRRRKVKKHTKVKSQITRNLECKNPYVSRMQDIDNFVLQIAPDTYVSVYPKPFLEKICFNKRIKKLAFDIVKDCPSADRECMVNEVYRYIVENYRYRWDPRMEDDIRSPLETIDLKGGDCEDLSILLISLLENLGIKTYMVMTRRHVYALACQMKMSNLRKYAYLSLLKNEAKEMVINNTDTIILKGDEVFLVHKYKEKTILEPHYVYWYQPPLSENFQSLDIRYHIRADLPVNIYIFPSRKEAERFLQGDDYYFYSQCENEEVEDVSFICSNLDPSSMIVVENPNNSSVTLDIKLEFWYLYQNPQIMGDMLSYTIEGNTCVILEPTAGPYGYPGYPPSVGGSAVAIDPITGKYIFLWVPKEKVQ